MILDKVIDLCCSNEPAMKLFSKFKKNNKPESSTPEVEEPVQRPPVQQVQPKKFADIDCKYEHVPYAKLPPRVKKAVETLGYTEETWNDVEGWVESDDKYFEDLSPEEREAAETLGWNATAWDTKYEDKDWNDLPDLIKRAATEVGFTQEIWDDDEWPEHLYKHWEDLTEDERKAMSVLGYSKWTWD